MTPGVELHLMLQACFAFTSTFINCHQRAATVDKGAGSKHKSKAVNRVQRFDSDPKKRHSQQACTATTTEHSIKEKRQQLPPCSLCEQRRTGAVHKTLTLHKSHAQLPVRTTQRNVPQGDSERVRRSNIAKGTTIPHDGLAEVSLCRDARRHKSLPWVQMCRVSTGVAARRQRRSGR
jgi:hypothetical protein